MAWLGEIFKCWTLLYFHTIYDSTTVIPFRWYINVKEMKTVWVNLNPVIQSREENVGWQGQLIRLLIARPPRHDTSKQPIHGWWMHIFYVAISSVNLNVCYHYDFECTCVHYWLLPPPLSHPQYQICGIAAQYQPLSHYYILLYCQIVGNWQNCDKWVTWLFIQKLDIRNRCLNKPGLYKFRPVVQFEMFLGNYFCYTHSLFLSALLNLLW